MINKYAHLNKNKIAHFRLHKGQAQQGYMWYGEGNIVFTTVKVKESTLKCVGIHLLCGSTERCVISSFLLHCLPSTIRIHVLLAHYAKCHTHVVYL